MELKRVVVTGLGAITPLGNSVSEYWTGLLNGVSGSGPISRFDTTHFKTKFACEVKNYNPEDYFDRKEIRVYDHFAQYAIISAKEAISDARLIPEQEDLDRIGVIWGAGIGGIQSFENEVTDFAKGDGKPRFSPFFVPRMIADLSAGHISIMYGFRGPNYCTVSACASSNNAFFDAFNYIRLGKANVIVCGGSEAAITPCGVGGFNAMRAISTRNEDYATASRPFSKSRDGFVLGEGGACLIFEELEHALARRAPIYAEVAGCGLSADAHHITAPHPDGLGATKVMENALEDAGMQPEDIDYINVHGTSTPLGDIAEVKAVKKIFGEHAYKLNISSTKSMTGHLLGAAGAIESVACIKAIQENIIPPTINFTEGDEDPEIDYGIDFTFGKACKREVRAALSNTFGFGGHNASIIFKKWDPSV
ncbi:MAG TPA: beta-ketoacyl-ACP synthase II [Bacteroidales bacterium]|jgi:3-oxoacyl-[acyl-carrier-protein] synthase II|nr:beta-ketoacyl-ACP synthase II [Bacteroidales bacterium]HPB35503.1 beta-ketoacyl-ACP synthase II [Bacteroidales bacterium]HPH56861.1 beta-ketoacyl-ACP synthase II [Bacteroidales bacterium]HQN87162.1 beta-ketoacyl-ACP synthase II [Bacteroidales bacterium]HQP22660.1 beta-ketoacyl-ACP synthase II [Bacteroidales bacterium]